MKNWLKAIGFTLGYLLAILFIVAAFLGVIVGLAWWLGPAGVFAVVVGGMVISMFVLGVRQFKEELDRADTSE